MSCVVALPPRITVRPRQRVIALVAATVAERVTAPTADPAQATARLERLMNRALHTVRRPSTLDEAEHAVRAVTSTRMRLGGTTACLARSIAALLYCRAHGHAPDLVLGLTPGTGQVHAWIEVEGRPAAEPSNPTRSHVTVKRYSATTNRSTPV